MICLSAKKKEFQRRMREHDDERILFLIEAHQTKESWAPGGHHAQKNYERLWRREAVIEGLRRGLIDKAPEIQR